MNKKVSTLLTCGLMLGGSLLCSSAFAENLEGVVGNGKYYKILRSAQHNGSWADTPVGTTYPAMYLSLDDEGNLTISTEIADLKDATWTVTKGVVDDTYTLTTASGHVLTLKNGVTSQTSFYTNDYKEDAGAVNAGLMIARKFIIGLDITPKSDKFWISLSYNFDRGLSLANPYVLSLAGLSGGFGFKLYMFSIGAAVACYSTSAVTAHFSLAMDINGFNKKKL